MAISYSKWFCIIEQLVENGDVDKTNTLDEVSQQEIKKIWDSRNKQADSPDTTTEDKKD